jgi:site-specific recombinase XerD
VSAGARRRVAKMSPRLIPADWEAVHSVAPQMVLTMLAYLDQIAVSQRPATVVSVNTDLRTFARFVIDHDPTARCVADVNRKHIEAFKIWQNQQPGIKTATVKPATFRRRIGMLRMFFVRIIEWGWDDAPLRVPIFFGDVPKRDEPLPKFIDDANFAKFMRALNDEKRIRRRLAIELLARTGMRVGELCELEHDAVTVIGDGHWLRIPVGKLHNDRYVPLHPHLVELIAQYQSEHGKHENNRLLSGEQGPLNRYAVERWLDALGKKARIGHIHPHQLRHTLATQAINRGMSIEAIAALLGHKSLDMTRQYARISNRVVADEYAAVTAKVEALYKPTPLPASAEGPNMRRLRSEVNHRLLGNGLCTRPVELDCSFESICENCAHFTTNKTFQPVLIRQRNHAARNGQTGRAHLFTTLIEKVTNETT